MQVSTYNKNKKQNLKQKLLTRLFLGFIAIHFLNRHQIFLNFYQKQAVRTLTGINFNYTYMFCLVLVIRTYFDKNLIYQEIQAARILIKQKPS